MRFLRLGFVIGCAVLGGWAFGSGARTLLAWLYDLILNIGASRDPVSPQQIPIPAVIAVTFTGALIGLGIGNLLLRMFESVGNGWDKMDGGQKVTLFLGIFIGMVASLPFMFLFSPLGGVIAPIAMLALWIGFSALAIYAMRSMEDMLPWQRGRGRSRKSGIKLLDTNILIDGRIYDVARTGFLEGQLYVPGFVLEELQHIADSVDSLRRQRGRRGLEVLRHLQSEFPVEIGTQDKYAPDPKEEVDSRLVRMALAMGADIVTNDFNLNRVAAIQKVTVLNLNDLALSLKPNVLPRETLNVTIVREGNQPGQGVAYLEDGTMVVVDHGKWHLNETLEVMVTQVIQTERGKMIFAEVPEPNEPETRPKKVRYER